MFIALGRILVITYLLVAEDFGMDGRRRDTKSGTVAGFECSTRSGTFRTSAGLFLSIASPFMTL